MKIGIRLLGEMSANVYSFGIERREKLFFFLKTFHLCCSDEISCIQKNNGLPQLGNNIHTFLEKTDLRIFKNNCAAIPLVVI